MTAFFLPRKTSNHRSNAVLELKEYARRAINADDETVVSVISERDCGDPGCGGVSLNDPTRKRRRLCASTIVVEALRLTARGRDHRNDHRVDGAAGRLRGSRYGHHAEPVHVRNLDRACVRSGLEACISPDLLR